MPENSREEPLILIVDDEETHLSLISDVLRFNGYRTIEADSADSALQALDKDEFDLILLDLVLPDMDGNILLSKILSDYPDQMIVMISGKGNIATAIESIKIGAYDFLEKPLEAERMLITIKNALEMTNLRHIHELSASDRFAKYGVVGESESIRRVLNLIDTLAPAEIPVVITGETGTGKGVIARAIHKNSKRSACPFIGVNCAAVPDSLVESEFFGYEKGAFTDARKSKPGLFGMANYGTLFLDEVGDLSHKAQAKLLQVLEDGHYMRLGGIQFEKVDVRIISASNKDLESMVKRGAFREDLYFRISGIPIHLSPLRDRKEDIIPLARFFLSEKNDGFQQLKELSEDAERMIMAQYWRGNARELRSFMQRVSLLSNNHKITSRDIKNILRFPEADQDDSDRQSLKEAREDFERSYISRALEECNGNLSDVARLLEIERSHLYRKMNKLGMKRD